MAAVLIDSVDLTFLKKKKSKLWLRPGQLALRLAIE